MPAAAATTFDTECKLPSRFVTTQITESMIFPRTPASMPRGLRPGCRVQIVAAWLNNHPGYPSNALRELGRGIYLERAPDHNCQSATLGRSWSSFLKPPLLVGDRALVIAALPNVRCCYHGTSHWVLLLANSGLLGWSAELEALRVVQQ